MSNITAKAKYMAGNPIVVGLWAGANMSERYRIYEHNGTAYATLVYTGIIYTLATAEDVNLSSLFAEKAKTAGVTLYMMVLVNASDVEHDPVYFSIYGGGLSKLMIRQLGAETIFERKLANVTANFFLSTRTNNHILCIAENELLPLYFYGLGHKFYVKVNGITFASYDHGTNVNDGLRHIDFAALREAYMSNNKLVSAFDIFTDDGYMFSVIVTEGIETDYFLKFKNAWGCWEKIALQNDVDYTPTFNEADKISVYDAVISDFVKQAQRKEITNIYTATTGYTSADERMFMLDMLQSDEVIFIAHGYEYAARVTTDSTLFGTTTGVPASVNLTIELLDVDTNYSALILGDDQSVLSTAEYNNITSAGFTILINN